MYTYNRWKIADCDSLLRSLLMKCSEMYNLIYTVS